MKVGQFVTRWLAGDVPMEMRVTEITPTHIICGPYTFDIKTGAEIDEELGWDATSSGSFIKLPGVSYVKMTDEEAMKNMTDRMGLE